MKIITIEEKESGVVRIEIEMNEEEHRFLILYAIRTLLISGAIVAQRGNEGQQADNEEISDAISAKKVDFTIN